MTDRFSEDQESEHSSSKQVHNEGNKRIRVSQACSLCRARKSKCNGARPACSLCRSLSLSCTYDPNPKKRGVPAGQSTALERRALLTELISSLLVNHIDDANGIIKSSLELSQEPSSRELESWNDKAVALLEKWKLSRGSEWVQDMMNRPDIIDDLSQSRAHELRSRGNLGGKPISSGAESERGTWLVDIVKSCSHLWRTNHHGPG